MSKNCFSVSFTGEKEVYGPTAVDESTIEEYSPGAVYICVQNTWDCIVTLGISKEAIEQYGGVVLNPSDGVSAWGSFVFDGRANWASINYLRAIAHSTGARLSFQVI